ncbi:GNAT family N-acetyltransferase [Coleofasciculus sp. FACHB-1120]|uniref:GNAT family N-acetyltransferase n=1 Tax=Coleofasciculus sp. FACHB-1120 TaxID=2692783 RepID=UPI00168722FA|nr:GNAT family N-acetyltransferase [Coleofasciculus sp. FACHB-1120]MBD2741397.1 GNAT family N-acetyltransferase [Coleofasciculus sp. FACHB-1120]
MHRQPERAAQPNGASHFIIRAAHQNDLTSLTEILADSFHPRSGIWALTYPLFRLGIYEDLRTRLRLIPPNYICLAAVATSSASTDWGSGEEASFPPLNAQELQGQERQGANADSVVGTIELGLRACSWQPWSSQYPYISNLAVHPSCRRRGVAQQLLLRCERTALEWGFCDLYLHVLENNHQARQLYLKAGYRPHQSDPSWSDWLPGRPRRLFLHKHLARKN